MIAILKKEINAFFASPIGYLVIGLFLVLNGLFLWLFKGEFNILDNGFSDLSPFFTLAPWVFIFLIPAVTMRSFSDEKKQGTLELLLTKPISHLEVVLGKYLGALILIILALIPTILYVFTVSQLGNPVGNIDAGSTFGSYLGLLFLAGAYTAIGVYASTISDNQIVAFIIAVALCFFFYFGFNGIADLISNDSISAFGMESHYKSMSRGVIDTRDLLYFVSITMLFIVFTTRAIGNFKIKPLHIVAFTLSLLALNMSLLAASLFARFDLTEDNRYTLNESVITVIDAIDTPMIVDVFLEGDDFPTEFRKLKTETKQLLEEFSATNSNVKFNFIDPLEDPSTREQNMQSLNARGFTPMQMRVKESGKTNTKIIFPWALASYNGQTIKVRLVKSKIGETQQDLVSNSVQHLEYAFADGFSKLVFPKKRKIAFLRGNGQLEDKYVADFIRTLRDYYFIAPFTLDSVSSNAQKTLNDLKNYDLIISAKPNQPFSEAEKQVIDQFTMQGGKSLWLIDAVAIDKDSLYNDSGTNVAVRQDLNLTDFFFSYGVRVNPVMVSTLYSAPITLAIGDGSDSQLQDLRWPYSPLASTNSKHPIVNNIDYVRFDFANQIDTLKNSISKTILLESAPLTKLEGVPSQISLDLVTQEQDPKTFNKGNQTLAVLLEGEFKSVYNNRVKPIDLKDKINTSNATKMIVIADGDIIKNEVSKNGPMELGFDRRSLRTYGNKEFLLNAVNYLLDDDGLINIRSKEINIAFMNQDKIAAEKTKWQAINIILPLVILGFFGFIFNFLRKKRYTK